MYSKIKIAGHPLHVMLVGFPVAFYTAAFVSFACYHTNQNPFWFKMAVTANIAGVVMALVAAIPGFVDWLNIPSTKRAKRVGVVHMLCNVTALLLFAINAYVQYQKWDDIQPNESPAILLTGLGFVLTLVAGYLGWALVQSHHVGVLLTDEQKRMEPLDGVKEL
jgi:uncharacterized membrane protein